MAAGAAVTAATVGAAVAVVAGGAAIGAGIALFLSPDGCLQCQVKNMISGAAAGMMAAMMMLTLPFIGPAAGAFALAGGGTLAAGAAMTATQLSIDVIGASLAMGIVSMMSSTGGGGGSSGDSGSSNNSGNKRGTVDESERKFTPEERKIADKLADEGKDVKALAEDNPQGVRNADSEVDGKPTEFKTPKPGATNNTIKNEVSDSISGTGQARDIIIDAENSGLTQAEAERALNRISGIQNGKLDSVRIIGKGFDITRNYP